MIGICRVIACFESKMSNNRYDVIPMEHGLWGASYVFLVHFWALNIKSVFPHELPTVSSTAITVYEVGVSLDKAGFHEHFIWICVTTLLFIEKSKSSDHEIDESPAKSLSYVTEPSIKPDTRACSYFTLGSGSVRMCNFRK
jgi:hypothetical protein